MVAQGVFSTGEIGSYCSVADVLALLAGYDLGALGDAEGIRQQVNALLPVTAKALEAAGEREFGYHAGCEVQLDGTGTERLSLIVAGLTPIVNVRAVSVNGRAVALGNVVVETGEESLRLRPQTGVFSRGSLNVGLTLDWGYATPPSDIVTAQAKLAAAEVLAVLSGSDGLAESVRLGDYEVKYGSGGTHGEAIRTLTEAAMRVAARYRKVKVGAV